jgi:pimeloyl-ACP methyl ester carboxylesterase
VKAVTVNGLSLNVEELRPVEPTATIVLVHGLAVGNLSSWYFTVAARLVDAGLHTVMYDLRGHGRSQRPATGYRVEDHVDDLVLLVDQICGDRPVYLLGNSFGGTVVFGFAARFPQRVAGLAVIESQPPTVQWRSSLSQQERQQWLWKYQSNGSDPRRDRIADDVRTMLAETSLREDIPSSQALPDEAFTALRQPILLVYGGNSPQATEVAPRMRELLPTARLVIVPDRYHGILIDDPGTVGDIVLSWLRTDCALARVAS